MELDGKKEIKQVTAKNSIGARKVIRGKYGAEVPFIRPKKLATDTAGFADVMMHGINELQKLDYKFDTFVNRDCTVPFMRVSDIKNSVSLKVYRLSL